MQLAEKVNTLQLECVSIVDSYGAMYFDDLKRIFDVLNLNLNKNIKIGLHSHNNMQLSFALAIMFINLAKNTDRNLIIDSSLMGIGRGAGNACSELLINYLNEKYNKKYDYNQIIKLIDEYIVPLSKKHSWGYSLPYAIAGQMVSTKVSPKEYLDENREGILARDSQLENFFGAIWEKMNTSTGHVAQNIIRYLSETTKPLCVQELSLLINENFKKTNKAVRMLLGLNLLIVHDEKEGKNKSYQVHPLVREFIHKNYNQEVQKPYVDGLVKMIMGNNLYAIIFINEPNVLQGTAEQWDSRNIIDSIETCLTSRNAIDALTILSRTFNVIVKDGYHAEFLALCGRVLDSVDWKQQEMATNRKRAALLSEYLDLLSMQEGAANDIDFYLKKYESVLDFEVFVKEILFLILVFYLQKRIYYGDVKEVKRLLMYFNNMRKLVKKLLRYGTFAIQEI